MSSVSPPAARTHSHVATTRGGSASSASRANGSSHNHAVKHRPGHPARPTKPKAPEGNIIKKLINQLIAALKALASGKTETPTGNTPTTPTTPSTPTTPTTPTTPATPGNTTPVDPTGTTVPGGGSNRIDEVLGKAASIETDMNGLIDQIISGKDKDGKDLTQTQLAGLNMKAQQMQQKITIMLEMLSNLIKTKYDTQKAIVQNMR